MRLYEIEVPARQVVATKRFKNELEIAKRGYPKVAENLKNFIEKRSVTDTRTATGKKDYPLQGSALAGYMHTHLIHGKIVIIYDVTPEYLRLITLGSHKIVDRITDSLSNYVLSLKPTDFTPFSVEDQQQQPIITDNEKEEIVALFWEFAASPKDRPALINATHKKWEGDLKDLMLTIVTSLPEQDKWDGIKQSFNGEDNLIKQIHIILKNTK